jgi:hypothetical protein
LFLYVVAPALRAEAKQKMFFPNSEKDGRMQNQKYKEHFLRGYAVALRRLAAGRFIQRFWK